MNDRYRLRLSPTARKALEHTLPLKIVEAVHAFVTGPLLENPQRVGKRCQPPLAPAWTARRGDYRVLYLINEKEKSVEVTAIRHRSDAYRG